MNPKKNYSVEKNPNIQNIWNYFPQSRWGIFRKFLISFLAISIIPLLVFGFYSYALISDVGQGSVDRVLSSLDQKTTETLELQATLTARRVEEFLSNCQRNLNQLTSFEIDENTYLNYYNNFKYQIWVPGKSGGQSDGVKVSIPLYKEISFLDLNGNELVKIEKNKIVSSENLKNVSNPKDTKYKSEHYFAEAVKLKEGENYVSHLNGFFVTPKEQFPDEESARLVKINKYYDGVIRFAKPKYVNGKKIGIVVLALDHRYLMEFTQHILPNSEDKVLFPNYSSGDYAFMFDDEGWIITHPKFWDIRGVDANGIQIPAYSSQTSTDKIKKGLIPFNLDSAGFIHPNYPRVAAEVRNLNSGSVITKNVGGTIKVMAYSPIKFNKGVYSEKGIFGGITIGSEINRFRGSAELVANELNTSLIDFRGDLIFFILITFGLALVFSFLLSRNFSKPIRQITLNAKKLAEGKLEETTSLQRNDEIGVLSNSFNIMAYELIKNRDQLMISLDDLQKSKNEIEKYTHDLEYQIKILQTIQKISNLLGKSRNFNEMIKQILENCVVSVGFDRAILYLIDEKGKYLECKDIYGFDEIESKFTKNSKFNLNRFDIIEVKVVKTGEIIFIEDFANYDDASEMDKKIHAYSKSNSFVYVPLRVKEKIIGIMGADKLRTRNKISQTDISSLQILANQASRIIENTRLYQETIRQRNFVNDVLENMLNGVITTNGSGLITSVNSAAKRILDLKEEIVGQNISKVFPRYLNLFDTISDELDRTGSYNDYNVKAKINDRVLTLALNVSKIHTEESTAGTIAIIQDLTERKKLEDHLQQMDRLISLGKFAAGIAHEIRNPLTGLSLFLDDLQEKAVLENNVNPLFNHALNEIERLEKLINEILDFAAPSKGSVKVQDVNELLTSTTKFVEKQLRSENIKLELDLDESLYKIEIDTEKIRQAFLNIILNSINALKGGGILKILTKNMPGNSKFKKTILITFEDNGNGISDDDKPLVFEPFFTKSQGGTGLGLSIVQTIIIDHGGKIRVEDSSLGGAKFSVYLPIKTLVN